MSENDENDKCVICLDYISENQDTYNLSCNHKYHTNCIVDWFRSGAKSCPCCNDIPSRFSGLDWPYSSTGEIHQQRIKNIRKISNKKSSPPQMKKDFESLKSFKNEAVEAEKLWKQFKKTSNYKNAIKTDRELRKKYFLKRKRVRKQECKILTSYPLLITYQ